MTGICPGVGTGIGAARAISSGVQGRTDDESGAGLALLPVETSTPALLRLGLTICALVHTTTNCISERALSPKYGE